MTGPTKRDGKNIGVFCRLNHNHIAWIILFSGVLPLAILAFLSSRSDNNTAEACGTPSLTANAVAGIIQPRNDLPKIPYVLQSQHSWSAQISSGSAEIKITWDLKNPTAGVNIGEEETRTVTPGSPVTGSDTLAATCYTPGLQTATATTKIYLLPSMTPIAAAADIKTYTAEE
ncbi:MAG TPA: hypothetical protein PLZ55_03160 [bacterium]|nr:hypothetical protein [bacterium]HPO07642.1 hypothetical protein [bacterium]HQO36017.1 hypothetical protein [bacterium]HQQ00282.1 hypothetical protein [bacterium]